MAQLFFLLAVDFHANVASYCKKVNGGNENGNFGFGYYIDAAYTETVTDLRLNPDNNEMNDQTCYSYEGSYCAPSTGLYIFKLAAKPAFQITVGTEQMNYTEKDCRGAGESRSINVTLNAHECTPFTAQVYQSNDILGACEEPQMFIYVNGKSPDYTNFHDCDKQYNCLYEYTGPKCEYTVSDVNFCNGNGSPKRGKRDDYLGCSCNSFLDNRFCEDPNQNKFIEQGLHVKLADFKLGNLIDNDFTETLSNTTSLQTNPDDYLDYPYSIIRKEGYFYVPQNSDYEFQLQGTTWAHFLFCYNERCSTLYADLTVGSKTMICDPYGSISSNTSAKVSLRRNWYYVKLDFSTGCPINYVSTKVLWKFYTLYNNNPTSFEEISDIYLGRHYNRYSTFL